MMLATTTLLVLQRPVGCVLLDRYTPLLRAHDLKEAGHQAKKH